MPRSVRLKRGDCGLLGAGVPSASAPPSPSSRDALGRAENLARTPGAAATPRSLRSPHSPDAAAAAGRAASTLLPASGRPASPEGGAQSAQSTGSSRRRRRRRLRLQRGKQPRTRSAAGSAQGAAREPVFTGRLRPRPARRVAGTPIGREARTCGTHLGAQKVSRAYLRSHAAVPGA